MFTAHVERTIAIAHRNGPPDSKCYTNHGHSVHVVVEIDCSDEVVARSDHGWSVDFHLIKTEIDRYDHKDLNVELDSPPSMENLAKTLWHNIKVATGFRPAFVSVTEGPDNRVIYRRPE